MGYVVKVGGELYHHGIKGQRWGVRRFQNSDGSLTNAGKSRYGVSGTPKNAIGNNKTTNVESMTKSQIENMKKSIANKSYEDVSDADVALLMKAVTYTDDKEISLKNKNGESYSIYMFKDSDELSTVDVDQMAKDCRYLGNQQKQMVDKILTTYIEDSRQYGHEDPSDDEVSNFKKNAKFTVVADNKGYYEIETYTRTGNDFTGGHFLSMECGYNPNDKTKKWFFDDYVSANG